MSQGTFRLIPFEGKSAPLNWIVTAHLSRRFNILAIRFELSGNLQEIVIPPLANAPSRKDRLWEQTCFECFLAPVGACRHWELNLSPAGHWNVYRFEDYRRGMGEEAAMRSLPFRVHGGQDSLQISLELDLSSILAGESALDVGVSAAILSTAGGLTHLALTHPGHQPDFHRRDGFISSLL